MIGIGAGGHIGDRPRLQLIRGFELAEVDLVGVDVDEHIEFEESAIALVAEPIAQVAHKTGRGRAVPRRLKSTLGNISLPHQPPLYGVSSRCPVSSVMNGPTTVPVPSQHGLDGDGAVVDALHHLGVLADDVVGMAIPVGL